MTSTNNNRNKETNPDVRPSKGQQSNENWDDKRGQGTKTSSSQKGESARRKDEQTNTSGYGSAQKASHKNVGPMDADFGELPSEKRRDRGSGVE